MSRVVRPVLPPVCEREVLRYAGCRNEDEQVTALMRACLAEALPVLTCTACVDEVDATPFTAQSQKLAAFAARQQRIWLLAATVGVGLDRLIRKYAQTSPAKAVMLQAIGTERVEALCDAVGALLAAECGCTAAERFSPGYGDLPLSVQREVLARLEAAKWIGVTLNDSLLMSPSKSVTAFVGVSHKSGGADKCRRCEKTDCAFRGAV